MDREISKKSILTGSITNIDSLSFFSVFKESIKKSPTKDAIIYEVGNEMKNSISFECLDSKSNQIANVLQRYYDSNNPSTKIVAVALEPTEKLPIILLAILKAGMTYLPLDLESPPERIKYILQEAKPAICIIEKKADEEKYSGVLTLTSEMLIDESKSESETFFYEENDSKLALVLYTSGSTGLPKGVTLTYTALMNRLLWQWKDLPYGPTENCCVFKTALTFVDSVCEIWGPLLQSRTLVVLPRHAAKNPEKLLDSLNKYQVQRIVLVPSHLSSIILYLKLQQDKNYLKHLNLWVCSGEALSSALVKEFFTLFDEDNKVMANFYGSTEIMGDVTFYLIRKDDIHINKTIPIGKPMDNCIVYIVDEHFNLVPHGQTGEMLIAGKNLANGYLSDNGYQNKFMKNPFNSNQEYTKVFRTGDLAKIENSLIFHEGRQDNQVKIRGQKVNLLEIEKAVLGMSAVEAAVVCFKEDEHQQLILCFVKPKNHDLRREDIEFYLNQRLLPYMMPKIMIIENFPLLINGKIDRQKLLKSYNGMNEQNGTADIKYDYNGIPNKYMSKAKILFPLLSSIIGQHEKCINIHSNFYELGGNSLNSIYSVSKLREKGLHIGITDFITARTMEDILSKIDDGGSVKEDDINPEQFVIEMLNDSHKNEVISMITESFLNKADLERWLLPEIKKKDYSDFIDELWEPLVEKELSFVIRSFSDKKILSVALNFDARDEPEVNIDSKLNIIFDFLEFLEKPIRDDRLPPGKNQIFHSFMMATNVDLSAALNVILMRLMEQKCLEIAKKKNFAGILTTNTSPLTQQLGNDIFGYEVMLDYQVNGYITVDKMKPFEKAPDDQRAVVSWKKIE